MFEAEEFWKNTVGIKSSEALSILAGNSCIRNIEKGERIIGEGDVIEEVGFIISGVFKAFHIDCHGKERIYTFGYLPGETATRLINLGTGVKSICSVVAVKDSVVLYVPMMILFKLTRENLDAAYIYNRMLGMSVKMLVEYSRILVECEVQERYQWFQETYPGLSELVKKKDIASFLGMSAESLSRLSKVLNKEELI